MKQDHKIISISCNSLFIRDLKKRAYEEGLTVSAYLRSLVVRDIAQHDKEKGR